MRTKEELIGYFVDVKGRLTEVREFAKKIGVKRDCTANKAEYVLFSNSFISEVSLEWSLSREYCEANYKEITVEELLKEEMKQYTVSEEFIKEAHKAACSTWKTKLEEQFSEVFLRNYKYGDKFDYNGITYMLTVSKEGKNRKISMTNIKEGSMIGETVYVAEVSNITQYEFQQILPNYYQDFKLITK